MSTTWILIANSSKALLYETQKALLFNSNGHAEDQLKLIDEFNHEESRKKASELVSDRVGSYQSGSAGHGSFVESTNPKEIEAERFARELVAELDAGRLAGRYDDLVIVANPHFQGLLYKQANEQLHRRVIRAIEKDYTQFKGRQLAEQLKENL